MKNLNAITKSDVPCVFDTETIEELALTAALPSGCDLRQFGESVRAAVCIYARDAATPSNNEERREVDAIYRLIERKAYEDLARAVEEISSPLRSSLLNRQTNIQYLADAARKRRGQQSIADRLAAHRFPEPAELRDPTTRAAAAKRLGTLISGGAL